jgi:hypothetical protein
MAQRRVIAGHAAPAESRERALVPDPYSQHPELPRVAGGGEPAHGASPLPERGAQARTARHAGDAGVAAAERTQEPRNGPARLRVIGPVDDRAERTVDVTEHRRPRRISRQRTNTLGQRLYGKGGHTPSMPDRVPALAGVTVPLGPTAASKHRRDGRATPHNWNSCWPPGIGCAANHIAAEERALR